MDTRLMEAGDYDALAALWSGFPGNAMTAADSRAGFERFLGANGPLCFVLLDGTGVAGSVMAGHDTRRGYVYHLAVSSRLQGTGGGRLLMERVERALLDEGIEKVHLFIYRDNPAVAFYERLGWRVRQDIHVMSKVLSGDPCAGTRETPLPDARGDGAAGTDPR
ncbi:MAG: GNAT family N-acetyltransferase [Candidatus Fermentibacter sp.]|nr:GNAT family N-acetyltransferase [Candidatus Fermentibacter sp.]